MGELRSYDMHSQIIISLAMSARSQCHVHLHRFPQIWRNAPAFCASAHPFSRMSLARYTTCRR